MEKHEFQAQMSRLIDNYGPSRYKTDRVALIFREVASIPVSEFARMVDDFISTCRDAPMVPDFKDQAMRVKEQLHNKRKHLKPTFSDTCRLCRGTGSVLARSKDNLAGYAFKCTCEAGRALRNPWPTWSAGDETQYEVVA